MALQERITYLEVNDRTYIRKRKIQVFHMMMRSLVQGLEYSIIFPSAWPYLKSMDVDTWFYGLVLAVTPVGTIISLPTVGWLYDKTKNTRQLYTTLNMIGMIGSLLYSMPFSPWLPLFGRFLVGARLSDNPMSQGELSWTFKTQDRLKAFSHVLVGFFIGVVLGPVFSFAFDHVDIHSGEFYIDHRNLPGLFIALLCLMLEISNRFMIVNLAKNCVDANGVVSGKGKLNNSHENTVCEKEFSNVQYKQQPDKLARDDHTDVQTLSIDNLPGGTKEIETSSAAYTFDTETVQDESKEAGVQLDIDTGSLKIESHSKNDANKTVAQEHYPDYVINGSMKRQNIDLEEGKNKKSVNDSSNNNKLSTTIPDYDYQALSNPYTSKVATIDCHESKSAKGRKQEPVDDVVNIKQNGDGNVSCKVKKSSNLLTLLREVSHYEIIGVVYCGIIMWLFMTEGNAIIPIVTQDHFGWSILQTNLVYLFCSIIIIFLYIILSRIGNRISDICYLFIILPIGSTAPIFLMIYSQVERGSIASKVLFCTCVLMGVSTEPFANAVLKSLVSKVTPLELQGSIGSFLTMATKGGNLVGPLYATLVLEYMVTCNLISAGLFLIGFLWLLFSLKRLNYRRRKYAVQTKA